ncbi:lantibiotic dehydratase [Catellatospora methionotrophica]|uniref:lantibiotic dehydratase n=1 Tax=Catellatospora methionotrophica TaxID=121620 RepID=UPI0033FA26F8
MVTERPRQVFRPIDAATIRVSTYVPGDGAWPDGSVVATEQWLEWLKAVWRRPLVAAAVTVASPTLAGRVAAALETAARVSDLDIRRLVDSLARYLVRMEGRATPFGLFAGVAPLAFGDVHVRLGEDHRCRTRCDSSWIGAIINRLERSSAVRALLLVTRNDLCFVCGDRLVVPWQPHSSKHWASTEQHDHRRADHQGVSGVSELRTLRFGPAVRAMLHAARTPTAVPDVIQAASEADRSKSAAYYDALIAALIDSGVLITSLRPTGTTPDVLAHVLTELDRSGATDLPEIASLVQELRQVQSLMQEADQQHWTGMEARTHLRREMLRLSDAADQPTVVDLRHDSAITLPPDVVDEATAAAEVLLRLGPGPNIHWAAYRDAFVARYGFGALVPVRELTDPTAGLGFPAHFAATSATSQVTPRDALLLRLAQQTLMDGRDELVVDDRLLQTIEAGSPGIYRTASNLDVAIEVRALTTADLAGGRFHLRIRGVGRSVAATTGRFLDLLEDSDRNRMLNTYRSVPACTVNGVVAQQSSPPNSASLENVVHTLPVVDHVIALGEHRPVSAQHLQLDDLAVMVDGARFYLVSMSRRCTVQPLMGNAAARHTMPMIARFLAEVTRATAAPVQLFDWGTAARHLPVRPRVRYRRTVLSPAQWQVDAFEGLDADGWKGRVEELRRRGVPGRVEVGRGDQLLRLDLDQARDRAVLHQHARGRTSLTLTETAGRHDFGWLGGRAHEVVIPLISTAAPLPTPQVLTSRAPLPIVSVRDLVLPGDGILLAKLYGPRELVDAIVLDHLANLLAAWQRPPLCWWMRFHDTSDHLRLRLHTDAYGHAAMHVGRWAAELRDLGLVTRLVLDTHQPETARYGTGPIMRAAEYFFAADSAATEAQLRTLRTHRHWRREALTAASLVDLSCAIAGSRADGLQWLVDHSGEGSEGRRPRLDPDVVRQTRSLVAQAPTELTTAWQHRRVAAAAYAKLLREPDTHLRPDSVLGSLLHMHYVRAHGIDAVGESRTYRLARAAALATVRDTSDRTGR